MLERRKEENVLPKPAEGPLSVFSKKISCAQVRVPESWQRVQGGWELSSPELTHRLVTLAPHGQQGEASINTNSIQKRTQKGYTLAVRLNQPYSKATLT